MPKNIPDGGDAIVQRDDPTLRMIAAPVEEREFGTDEFARTLKRMDEALDSQDDGVAIAAPQIGISKRIFLVSSKIFDMEEGPRRSTKTRENLVFANPIIVRRSRKTRYMEEGCLSVRYLYGSVRRNEKATVEAQDEHGKRFTYHGSGLLAEIFQHEIDHLNGILFIDMAKDIREILPQDLERSS